MRVEVDFPPLVPWKLKPRAPCFMRRPLENGAGQAGSGPPETADVLWASWGVDPQRLAGNS